MYDTAKKSRAANKAKAERLANRPIERVDSSDWTPPPLLNAEVKTGMRPVSKQALKRGGKVKGEKAKVRADRVARKAGGRVETKGEQPLVDRYINRDLKKANDYRDGKKHEGALKRGGRTGKDNGGAMGSFKNVETGDQITPSEVWGKTPADAKKQAPKAAPMPPTRKYESIDDLVESYDTSNAPKKSAPGMKKGGAAKEKWIQKAIKKPGALHKQPGVPEGKKIPAKKLEAASEKGGKLGKRARLAKTLRAMHKDGGKVHSDAAEDKAMIKSMVKPSALKGAACYGGRMKKADGGPMMGQDPRLGIVKPKAMEFGSNVVTPGLKKGGRAKKADGGGLARAAGPIAVERLAPVEVMSRREDNLPAVGSGLMPQGNVLGNPPPSFDPDKYAGTNKLERRKMGTTTGGVNIFDYAGPTGGRDTGPQNPYGDAGGGLSDAGQRAMSDYGGIFARGGRAAHARGGKAKGKGKTNINIVIAQTPKHPADQAGMPPMAPPAGGPPKGVPVAVPPVGAGAGAMPPMGSGMPPQMPPMPPQAAGAPPAMGARPSPFKKGGRVTKVAHSYKDMEAGAGSGEGRLQKTDIAKRMPKKAGGQVGHRSYKSYKDMDAGAGSGFGRLEKTAIEAKKSRKG